VLSAGQLDIATGGVAASPIAALCIKHIPARALGLGVSALLLLTNLRELAAWADAGLVRWLGYALVALAVVVAALRPKVAASRAR